jgi:hypothetical protein
MIGDIKTPPVLIFAKHSTFDIYCLDCINQSKHALSCSKSQVLCFFSLRSNFFSHVSVDKQGIVFLYGPQPIQSPPLSPHVQENRFYNSNAFQ